MICAFYLSRSPTFSPQLEQALTLFIPKDSYELRFLYTFVNTNRQINRNLYAKVFDSIVVIVPSPDCR